MNFKKISLAIILVVLLLTGCSKKKKEEVKSETDKVLKSFNSGTELAAKQIKKIKEQSEKQMGIIKSASKNKLNEWGRSTKETKEELWERYNKTKKAINLAKSNKNYEKLIKLLKKESKTSEKLGRRDIQAWQLNNVGYYSIEEFKKKTGYDERMKQLASIKNYKKRKKYYKETAKILENYKKILDDSYPYLIKAKKIDDVFPDEKRKKIIANNLAFINDIKNIINKAKNDEK